MSQLSNRYAAAQYRQRLNAPSHHSPLRLPNARLATVDNAAHAP